MCFSLQNHSSQHWVSVFAHHDVDFIRLSITLLRSYGGYATPPPHPPKRLWKNEKNTCLKHTWPVEGLHGITENEKVEPSNSYEVHF